MNHFKPLTALLGLFSKQGYVLGLSPKVYSEVLGLRAFWPPQVSPWVVDVTDA